MLALTPICNQNSFLNSNSPLSSSLSSLSNTTNLSNSSSLSSSASYYADDLNDYNDIEKDAIDKGIQASD